MAESDRRSSSRKNVLLGSLVVLVTIILSPSLRNGTSNAISYLGYGFAVPSNLVRGELEPDVSGAVVAAVMPFGAAYRRGLTPGSLVLEVAGEPVASPEDAAEGLGGVGSGEATPRKHDPERQRGAS